MHCRRHVTVQLVRGDGTRVTGLTVSLPYLLAACALLALTGLGVGLAANAWLRGIAQTAAAVTDQNREQRTFIESMTREIANLRREVGSWHALHAHILAAFSPAGEPTGPRTGIGGAAASPPRARVPLAPSQELGALAAEIQEAGASLRALKRLVARASSALAALPSTWPIRGAVNSEFGTRVSPWSGAPEFHSGIDIGAPHGTLVRAPAAGMVVLAGHHHDYGLAVILDHGQDIRTVYAHLSMVRVTNGQQVARGAEIGQIGTTGRSSGPHLHYEILVSGQTVNPRSFFWD
jgi:murein DD-endopeptidase MepM/ murein hydrolase activator NlpD